MAVTRSSVEELYWTDFLLNRQILTAITTFFQSTSILFILQQVCLEGAIEDSSLELISTITLASKLELLSILSLKRDTKMHHYSLLICCFSVLSLAHFVFSSADNCKKFDLHPKPVEILPNHPYGLWPGLTNKIDLENGETLPGFHEVKLVLQHLSVVFFCSNSFSFFF
jgi:hypothetical protein